ncbi:MAG: hypothetical protein KAI24_22915 [Planctomycetes bacterium]|nr:hypothetical protein [Planctomycetota bacterium]
MLLTSAGRPGTRPVDGRLVRERPGCDGVVRVADEDGVRIVRVIERPVRLPVESRGVLRVVEPEGGR